MYVQHSGWTKEHGTFCCLIFIDENKTDYELEYGDGKISKQDSPFQYVTADWNNDGDRYTQFGAWFKSRYGGCDFLTPVDLVTIAVDGLTKEHFYDNEYKAVKGITVPLQDRRPCLEDRIRQSEQRAANQEAERNRKMKALGIRHPGEPWAR